MSESMAPLSREVLEMVAQRFRVLAEPMRLLILQQLQEGERSVTALTQALAVSQPNVSKHLKALQEAGFVGRRQVGTVAYYRITDEMVFDLCHTICQGLRERIEQQDRLLRDALGDTAS